MIAAICSSQLPPAELLVLAKEQNRANPKAAIQLIDSSSPKKTIISKKILLAAEQMAIDAMRENVAVSDRLEIEFLLFFGKSTHVNKAVANAGIKNADEFVVVLLGSEDRLLLEGAIALIGAKEGKKNIAAACGDDLNFIEEMALSRVIG